MSASGIVDCCDRKRLVFIVNVYINVTLCRDPLFRGGREDDVTWHTCLTRTLSPSL